MNTQERYLYVQQAKQPDGWYPTGDLNIIGQGVDLFIQTNKYGFQYEDRCFESIAQRLLPSDIAIGPHLLDFILGQHSSWASEIRPDAMIFTPTTHNWELHTLVEMKSGKRNGIHRKLEGFSVLLDKIRTHPRYLQSALTEFVGDMFGELPHIRVPENYHIQIVLMHPYANGTEGYAYDEFPITHFKVDRALK